jgi:hypothetical protein
MVRNAFGACRLRWVLPGLRWLCGNVTRTLRLLPLCIVAGCGSNVHPGDQEFPVVRANPQRLLNVTLIRPPAVRAIINVRWAATNYQGPNAAACTFFGTSAGAPSHVRFSIVEPLPVSGQGRVLHGQLAFDKYEPGRCGYEFTTVGYRILSSDDSELELISYRENLALPAEARVDLWCYSSPNGDLCFSLSWALAQISPRITHKEAEIARSNGAKEPPALVRPNTRAVVIQLHDLNGPAPEVAIATN